jgi:UDP-glucose 6-dehydrogenase
VEVASGGFTLVREQLRLVRTEFFITLTEAMKEKSEAIRIVEAIRIAEATARAIAVDISKPRIAAGNNDDLPTYEPGLDEVVKSCRGRNLFFSTEVEKHVAEADIVFVSVNTPTKTRGLGAGKAADLTYWESAARMIADVSKSDKIVVEKSTVPVKTAEAFEKILTHNNKRIKFQILSSPEFLAEGTAIADLDLFFSTEIERHVAEADIVFVSVNTPTNTEAGAAAVNEESEVTEAGVAVVNEESEVPAKVKATPARIEEGALTVKEDLAVAGLQTEHSDDEISKPPTRLTVR